MDAHPPRPAVGQANASRCRMTEHHATTARSALETPSEAGQCTGEVGGLFEDGRQGVFLHLLHSLGDGLCRVTRGVEPEVLTWQGSPISSHRGRIASATFTTFSKGAPLGSRSRMHQSGLWIACTRLDHMCRGIVPRLIT